MSFRTVVITKQAKISYKNRFLVVKQDIDEKYIHLSEIDTVIVDSISVSISSYLLKELADNKIINVDLLKYSLPNLEFRGINKDNFYDVCMLDINDEDKEFVASNKMSLAEAYLFKTMGAYVLPIAIYRNRVPIGFTMITKGNIGDNIKGEYINNYCILRMMIEAKHQNKGLGKLALKQLIEIIKSISVNETFIWVSTEEKNAKAIHVYEESGFKKTKDYCGEEIILKYDLSK